jgi:hypothetical protein
MKLKHVIAAATTAAFIGSLGVSIAGAASGHVDASPTTTSASHARRHPAVRAFAGALKTAAEAIGISRQDLWHELGEGTSIAAVATAHDVDPKAVVDALVAAGTQKIDAAEASGAITAERAANLKDALADRAEKFVAKERRARRQQPRSDGRRLDAVASAVGIDRKQLVEELKAGKTIAAIATEHGVDPQHVIDQLVDAANKRIAARQQALEQRAQQRISKYVNEWTLETDSGS